MPTSINQNRNQRTQEEQLERLFDLLPDDLYDVAAQLPYAQRALIERWFTHEDDRLASVVCRVAGGENTPAVLELLDILTADPLDLQAAGTWLSTHREEVSAQLLAELVSAAMGRGVMDLMSSRAGKRQGENREKKAQALRLWEHEYKGKEKMTKGKAAPRIAVAVGLAASTVRRYLRGL